MLLVVAKIIPTLTSVWDVMIWGIIIAKRHHRHPMVPIRNVIGRDGIRVKRVVVTGPITVWVTRLGLGIATVPNNTLLGDTHDKIGCQQHP